MTALAMVLGVLLLLGLMPVGVRAVFDGKFSVYLTAFGIPLRVYPGREKAAEKQKKDKKPTDRPKEKKKTDTSSLNGYLHLLTQLLGRLRRKIRIRELTLHVIFGGSDPALNYGRAWAAIGTVMPVLEQLFRIKKRDVGAYFSEDEPTMRFYLRAHATLTVAGILHIAVHALSGWLKIQNHKNSEKAVQPHEQPDQRNDGHLHGEDPTDG